MREKHGNGDSDSVPLQSPTRENAQANYRAQAVHACSQPSRESQRETLRDESNVWSQCNVVKIEGKGAPICRRWKIRAVIEGKERDVLVDTGSDVSVVSRRALNGFNRESRDRRQWFSRRLVKKGGEITQRLRNASGEYMEVDSICKLRTSLGDNREDLSAVSFHIVPGMSEDIVIGMSGLRELGLEVELRKVRKL